MTADRSKAQFHQGERRVETPHRRAAHPTRSKPGGPVEACAVRRHGVVVALGEHGRLYGSRCPVRITGIEWRRRIVFDAELDCPGGCLARDFGGNNKPKIDARTDTSRSEHVAVLDDPGLLVRGPDERQQISKSPMRGCPTSLEQSGDTQVDCAGAYRGDILRGARLAADELYGFAIAERVDHAQVSPGDADQVERRTVHKCVRRHEAEPAIAWHGRLRFRDNVSGGLGKAREYL